LAKTLKARTQQHVVIDKKSPVARAAIAYGGVGVLSDDENAKSPTT